MGWTRGMHEKTRNSCKASVGKAGTAGLSFTDRVVEGIYGLGQWNRGFESRSRHGCVSAFFCVVLSCVGSGLATG